MKYIKNVTAIIFLAVSITSFVGCKKISGLLGHSVTDEAMEVDNSNTSSSDASSVSISKAKEDSLAQARKDSLAQVKAAKQAKKIEEELSSLSDSINDLNSRIAELENKSENVIDKSSVYTFIAVEFVLTMLILLYLYGRLNNQIRKVNSESHHDGELEGDISESKVNIMIQKAIKDLALQINRKNSNQDEIVNKIDQRVSRLEGQNDASFHSTQSSIQHLQSDAQNKEEEPKTANTFYMPRTRKDLLFDDNKKKFVKDETTYFKFIIKKENKAEFTFDPLESNIIGAYDDRENSLATVCEIESKSKTPTEYKNIMPGEAELRGNIWRVTRKLKLEYV